MGRKYTLYGEGGFDERKADNNIIEDIDTRTLEEAKEERFKILSGARRGELLRAGLTDSVLARKTAGVLSTRETLAADTLLVSTKAGLDAAELLVEAATTKEEIDAINLD